VSEVEFKWSVMSPSDFVKFRMAEFDENARPVSDLNPASTWVVYVEAVNDEGTCVVPSTVTTDQPTCRPTDKEAYGAAWLALPGLIDYCRDEGYAAPDSPLLRRAPVPDAYRA
jgi:hypothetical protein